jgi:hypothetical protein
MPEPPPARAAPAAMGPAGIERPAGARDPRVALAEGFERWLREERGRPPARDPREALAEAFARRRQAARDPRAAGPP